MPDEQTFLDAIHANPAEDGPRLVYADWLEEHGQTDRAEFIRLLHQLRQIPQRLEELRHRIEPAWLAAVYNQWQVVLRHYPPSHKIAVIKTIREVVGNSLREAKDISESLPRAIVVGVNRDQAEYIRSRFGDYANVTVEAVVQPEHLLREPPRPLLNWSAFLVAYEPHAKLQTIKAVRECTGLGLWESRQLVEHPLPQAVRTGLTLTEAETIQRTFAPFATVMIEPETGSDA